MRLVSTIPNDNEEKKGLAFSYFLTKEGIPNNAEEVLMDEGKPGYRIWVYEEDDFDRALAYYKEFIQNPHDPRFAVAYQPTPVTEVQKMTELEEDEDEQIAPTKSKSATRQGRLSPSPFQPVSIVILI